MPQFQKLAVVNNIKDSSMESVKVRKEFVLIAKVDGDFFAISDICSSDGVNLSMGVLEGFNVKCPCSSTFNVKTGEVVSPPATESVKKYEVKVEGEFVLVKI